MTLERISPSEAAQRLQSGSLYLDVRTVEEFVEGHPAGAYNLPVMLQGAEGMVPNPDFARIASLAFPKDEKIVVGCRGGVRSVKAATLLAEAGFTNVVDQRAGWDGARDPFGQIAEPGWSRAGLPVEKGSPSGRSYADLQKKA